MSRAFDLGSPRPIRNGLRPHKSAIGDYVLGKPTETLILGVRLRLLQQVLEELLDLLAPQCSGLRRCLDRHNGTFYAVLRHTQLLELSAVHLILPVSPDRSVVSRLTSTDLEWTGTPADPCRTAKVSVAHRITAERPHEFANNPFPGGVRTLWPHDELLGTTLASTDKLGSDRSNLRIWLGPRREPYNPHANKPPFLLHFSVARFSVIRLSGRKTKQL